MTKIDVLVAEFNADFSVNKVALQGLLERNDLVYLDNTETMYSISNRKEHVCQMFAMRDRGEITWNENIELQARTKGYAVDTALTIARPMRAAINKGINVADEATAELEALRAQVAKLQSENEKLVDELGVRTKEVISLRTSLRHICLSGIVTKVARRVLVSVSV